VAIGGACGSRTKDEDEYVKATLNVRDRGDALALHNVKGARGDMQEAALLDLVRASLPPSTPCPSSASATNAPSPRGPGHGAHQCCHGALHRRGEWRVTWRQAALREHCRAMALGRSMMLTRNVHLAPNTQQAEQAGFTRAKSHETC
jgi:hypothetical protein